MSARRSSLRLNGCRRGERRDYGYCRIVLCKPWTSLTLFRSFIFGSKEIASFLLFIVFQCMLWHSDGVRWERRRMGARALESRGIAQRTKEVMSLGRDCLDHDLILDTARDAAGALVLCSNDRKHSSAHLALALVPY